MKSMTDTNNFKFIKWFLLQDSGLTKNKAEVDDTVAKRYLYGRPFDAFYLSYGQVLYFPSRYQHFVSRLKPQLVKNRLNTEVIKALDCCG
jgi:hypothetical protein